VSAALIKGTAAVLAIGVLLTPSQANPPSRHPVLVGRAVLPALTLAGSPPAGAFFHPVPDNGVAFPLPGQPVEGFSAIVDGREPGEFLAMPDNGFGSKVNSPDFLIRAYYIRPRFKTARGGDGTVEVGDFISFRDPDHRIGFPLVNEGTTSRLLTGGDIDPESLQRGRHGDLWVGEEFGPWILHFSSTGVLLDPPFAMPDGIRSPDNPFLNGAPATHPSSRGLEGMAISPDRKHLYAALEGAPLADPDQSRRHVYEFSTKKLAFTGRVFQYRAEASTNLVADMWAVDAHRLVVIERDRGFGLNAAFRRIYLVDLRVTNAAGFLVKTQLVDLSAVPDPDLVSLPALHPGDVGLGDPFRVTCESVEAVHLVKGHRLLVGCDNNLPNSGRNPALPDDSEFILVDVPGLRGAAHD
jgi:glycerophosphoryl diester phosphodiesterase